MSIVDVAVIDQIHFSRRTDSNVIRLIVRRVSRNHRLFPVDNRSEVQTHFQIIRVQIDCFGLLK